MKGIKFLIAIFIATFAYVSISFFAGSSGLWAYSQLVEQKKEIARRTDSIQAINNELRLEYNALLKDEDVISAYARKLDYVSDGEKLVKISGLKPYQGTLYDTGTATKHKEGTFFSEALCKILSLSIGLLSLFIMFLFDLGRGNFNRPKKRRTIKEIPIYEVPQI